MSVPLFFTKASGLVIDDMVAWWKLDEGTGTTINDSSGSGFTGTASSAIWTNAGTGKGYSRAYNFQGTNYINIGDVLHSDELTIACWIQLSNVKSKYPDVFHKTNKNSAITSLTSSSNVPSIDTWHHIAGVLRGNGNGASVYLNGVNVGNGTQTDSIRNTSSAIQLGTRTASNGNNWMVGWMQDARIYPRGLSDPEVELLHSTTNI